MNFYKRKQKEKITGYGLEFLVTPWRTLVLLPVLILFSFLCTHFTYLSVASPVPATTLVTSPPALPTIKSALVRFLLSLFPLPHL